MQNHGLFSSNNIYFCKWQKAVEKKSKDDEQNLEERNSARRRSQAKCQLVKTRQIKRIELLLFCHIINILLTELSWSVWENLDLDRLYRPHCVRSIHTTSVKILPYRPLVQSLNSPFFPPHIGAEPGRAKEESRITCMRMLRTPPFFPPNTIFGTIFQIWLVARFSE